MKKLLRTLHLLPILFRYRLLGTPGPSLSLGERLRRLYVCYLPRFREYTLSPDGACRYLVNSKVACSSLKKAVTGLSPTPEEPDIHQFVKRKGLQCSAPARPYAEKRTFGGFTFTFVRNPFDRLVSCFEQQFSDRFVPTDIYHPKHPDYLFGYMQGTRSFEDFLDRILALPHRFMNVHFCRQSDLIFDGLGRSLVDYVGKYENLEADFAPLKERFGFEDLPHLNRTESRRDWRTYYTPETAKKVYRKFRRDFRRFGYEDSYRELLNYLKGNGH